MKKIFASAGLLGLLIAVSMPAPAQTVLAKRGTDVSGALQQTLNSKKSHDGDTFTINQKDTFFHKNPALHGGVIEGHVENVTPASPTHKATMTLVFDDVKLPDGSTVPYVAKLTSISVFEPKTHHIRDAGLVVGGAVAGHMLASKRGIKHGGLAGAGAGFALASSLKSDINVKRGTIVKMKLTDDLVAGTPQSGSNAPEAAPAATST